MKSLLIFSAAMLVATAGNACNTCGCAASNQYLGILPQSGNFIGLQYDYRWYESHHDASEANKAAGQEYYQSLQLWGRYTLGRRLQLYAFLPYLHNNKIEDGTRTSLSGIGDATLLINYQVLRPQGKDGSWQHYLVAGGGLKAPTGAYNKTVLGSGDAMAPSMQAGTGSWDFVGDANYTLQHGSWGLNAEAAYTMTMPNFQEYKYGNRVSTGIQAFHQWQGKRWRLLPALGMRYEESAADYDNYPTRSVAAYTGGYMMYGTVTMRAYSRHYGLELAYSIPLSQEYGDGLVESKGKLAGGLVYLF